VFIFSLEWEMKWEETRTIRGLRETSWINKSDSWTLRAIWCLKNFLVCREEYKKWRPTLALSMRSEYHYKIDYSDVRYVKVYVDMYYFYLIKNIYV
jgi:hypothetical protein